jgi:1,4-dihydroxy-2-naphthoyl-CoA hydrolase
MTATTPAAPKVFRSTSSLDELNALSRGTAMQPLGIVFTELGSDYLRATMPVDERTRQPYGLLHGGASVLLAETLGSTAGNLCVGPDELCVGIEINANHLAAVREGRVTGTARPLHVGGRTQVWEIRIEDDLGRLVCISRLTLAVIQRRG